MANLCGISERHGPRRARLDSDTLAVGTAARASIGYSGPKTVQVEKAQPLN
jgi:hypothetical protein